jgi:hypothetical protein
VANELPLKWTADASDVLQMFQRMQQEALRLEATLEKLGGPALKNLSPLFDSIAKSIAAAGFKADDAFNTTVLDQYAIKLKGLHERYEVLQRDTAELQKQLALPFRRTPAQVAAGAEVETRDRGRLQELTGIADPSAAASTEAINAALKRNQAELRTTRKDVGQLTLAYETLSQFFQVAPGVAGAINQLLALQDVLEQLQTRLASTEQRSASAINPRLRQALVGDVQAADEFAAKLGALIDRLTKLRQARADLLAGRSEGLNVDLGEGKTADELIRERAGFGRKTVPLDEFTKQGAVILENDIKGAEAATQGLAQQAGQFVENMTRGLSVLTDVKSRIQAIQSAFSPNQSARDQLFSGEAIAKAVQDRAGKLSSAQDQFVAQIAALQERAIDAVGGRAGEQTRRRVSDAFERENKVMKELEIARRRLTRADEELTRLGDKRLANAVKEAGLASRTGQDVTQPVGRVAQLAGETGDPRVARAAQAFVAQLREVIRLQTAAASAAQRSAEAYRGLDGALKATNLLGPVSELRNESARLTEELVRLKSAAATGDLSGVLNILGGPQLAKQFDLFIRKTEQLNRVRLQLADGTKRSAEETAKLVAEEQKLVRQTGKLGAQVAKGLDRSVGADVGAKLFSPDQLAEQLQAKLPRLEQLLIGAFSDIGRRFVATLQFALSGTLIFTVQQFVKELFQSAVQVERAFADIETAFKFDIKGLDDAEVQRRVEGIRREVLSIANDLNVLPTEANKAAFVMVARFQETGNALIALRAQLLATKVSGIDQTEVLRALTASAEGFAVAIALSNDNLSLQQRLLQRETIAAKLYGQILDQAVLIQQRWGVEVEDTLEGTARAVEVFRELGFTAEETQAAVAAVGLRLGQTGTNVAERLNRAFGAIGDPKALDDLVAFANTTDNLVIALNDLENPAKLLQSIASQTQNLDSTELANLIQLIGKRRETDVVAAFFGSQDIQQDILNNVGQAAGKAEERFAVLSKTTSELIQSIIVKFDELAQNLERIGALTPIKLLLSGVDQLLGFINGVLKGVRSLYDALNDLPIPLGTILQSATLILTTFIGVQRALQAMAVVMTHLNALSGSKNVADAIGGVIAGAGLGAVRPFGAAPPAASSAASSIVSGGLLVGLMKQFQKANDGIIRSMNTAAVNVWSFTRSVPGMVKSMLGFGKAANVAAVAQIANTQEVIRNTIARRFGSADATGPFVSLLKKAPNAGPIGLTIAAVVGGLVTFNKALKDGEEAVKDFRLRALQGTVSRNRQFAAEGSTPEEERLINAQGRLTEANMNLEEAVNGFWQFLSGNKLGLLGGAGVQGVSIARSGAPAGLVDTTLDPKFGDFWRAQLEAQRIELIESYQELFEQALANPDFRTKGRRKRPRNKEAELALSLIQDFRDAVAEGADGKTIDALGQAALAQLEEALTGAASVAGQAAIAIATFQKDVATANRQRQVGFLSPEKHLNVLESTLSQMQSQINALPEGSASRAALQEEFEKTQAEFFQAQADQFKRRIQAAQTADPVASALAEIRILQEQFTLLAQQGRTNSDDYVEATRALHDAQTRLADSLRERRFGLLKTRLDTARSAEAAVIAGKAYVKELEAYVRELQQDAFARGELGKNLQAVIDKETEAYNQIKREVDLAARQASVKVRSNAPILNSIAQINAQLAAVAVEIGSLTGVERAEAVIRQNELLAQRAQEMLRQQQAFVAAQAGVNDSLTLLKGQTVLATNELALAARLFGTQSAEYLELRLKLEQAQFALGQALVELDILNRRLGSDLTDQFQQATIDLAEVMLNLANPDLGELEKARLELEKRQAENALQQAFFNDALFELDFLKETGKLSSAGYLSALRGLLSQVDTTTDQGKQIFLQIKGIIDGLTNDLSNLAFNVPTAIRLPTLFEIRRALAADALGVNYMDNRQQNIYVEVREEVDAAALVTTIAAALGDSVNVASARVATGNAMFTIGGF